MAEEQKEQKEQKERKEEEVGFVEHWFGHISVAGIKVTKGKIKAGDTIHIKGHTTDFDEKIATIQCEHKTIEEAKKGKDIGIKVSQRCREHDKVFRVA